MRTIRIFGAWALGAAALFGASGCLFLAGAAGGGAAGVRELTDKSVVYAADRQKAESAAVSAISTLGGSIAETVREAEAGGDITIRGKAYDGKALTIDIEPQTPRTTKIDIRVGRIGDKDRAIEYQREIQRHLEVAAY
jgi:hypothetical protein